MDDVKKVSMQKHRELKGKLTVESKAKVNSLEDLSLYYTPGVGAVSSHVAQNLDQARDYTGLNNSVAIVSDGSAVLGLGNIGPHGALPVMEGKAMLFKEFAGIDGYPIVLNVHSADEIVAAIKAISPSFGGINLEDIAAPICFEVEDRLKSDLNIPVMHDDQHGTAIVVLAGLINSLKIIDKQIDQITVTVVGAGAAGVAISKLLSEFGVKNIRVVDSKGIISTDRNDLNTIKQTLVKLNSQNTKGTLEDAIVDSDVFIGVSKANLLTPEMIKSMNKDAIIFAMANPDPEILPDIAKQAGARIIATGRSDFANQVNNALAFPGIFRGALDNQVASITEQHKIDAANAIAGLIDAPNEDQIIPDVFDKRLVPAVARVIT